MDMNIKSLISTSLYNELKSLSNKKNVSKIRSLLRKNNVLHQLETNIINKAFSFGEYKFVKRHGKFTFNHIKSSAHNNADSDSDSDSDEIYDLINEKELKPGECKDIIIDHEVYTVHRWTQEQIDDFIKHNCTDKAHEEHIKITKLYSPK